MVLYNILHILELICCLCLVIISVKLRKINEELLNNNLNLIDHNLKLMLENTRLKMKKEK